MTYAQIKYQELVGNSHLTIAEIGCFIVADANLLEKIGIEIDPPTLGAFYEQHNLFLYDLTDRANDDITWSTITQYRPQLVVSQLGTSGWPTSDLSIVEFRYRSHTGYTVTHFCAVHSAADHSIIDSYDGQVKTPAHYQAVYGQPVAWATFENHVATPEPPTPSAPAAAPAAAAPAPQPVPVQPKQLVLPKLDHYYLWHTYNIGGPYTLPYATHLLDPYHYGPLTYDILGNPAPNIYLIKTEDYGEVAIYAGPDTVAQFPGGGHGDGESTGIPVDEVVPAPSAPAISYTRFETPMALQANKDTHTINFVSGTEVAAILDGSPFEAVGKATLPTGDVYFLDDNSFGIADERGTTPLTVGLKTIDLSPAAEPAATAPAATPQPAAPAAPTPGPSTSNLPWQRSVQYFMNPVPYVVKQDMEVYNFATGNDVVSLSAGTVVRVGGKFLYNGTYHYLSQSSIEKGTWYGFPGSSLVKQDATNTPMTTGDDIDQLGDEAVTLSKTKHVTIKAAASTQGFLARFHKNEGV